MHVLCADMHVLCWRYRSKSMSVRVQPFDKDENVFQSAPDLFNWYLSSIKSITIALFRLVLETLVEHGSSRRFFNSLANSDFGDFRNSPSFLK